MTAYANRDSVKNEANKLMASLREKRGNIDQNLANVEKLNSLISIAENDMQTIKSRYTAMTQERNSLAKLILDRNDELCVMHEKLNQKDQEWQHIQEKISDAESNIKKFQLLKMELTREVEYLKTIQPIVSESYLKIKYLEHLIQKKRTQTIDLGKTVEDPKGDKRTRYLKGMDYSDEELSKKIEELETQLATKEVLIDLLA